MRAIAIAVVLAGCVAHYTVDIDPEAIAGCRTPTAAGCEACCATAELVSGYVVRSGDYWYNENNTDTAGVCPMQLPACARCTERDEQQLRDLAEHPTCRCEGVDPGLDPCFAPDTCECFCERIVPLLELCTR